MCACTPGPSLDSRYKQALALRKDGKPDAALQIIDKALPVAAKKSPQLYWKFYLKKAELVQQKHGGELALRVLQQEPPAGAEFAALRGQSKMLQAYAEFSMAKYSEAEERLRDGKALAEMAKDTGLLISIEFLHAQLLSRLGKLNQRRPKLSSTMPTAWRCRFTIGHERATAC